MKLKVIETPDAPKAIGPYSQAIRAGNTVYLSGQIGLDPATGKLVDGVEAQAHQVLQNLRAVAQAAGGELDDIVKVTLLLADLADFAQGQRDHGARTSSRRIRRARPIRWPRCPRARGSRSRAFWCCAARTAQSRDRGDAQASDVTKGTGPTWLARQRAARARARKARRGARRQARAARHRARRRISSCICRCATRITRASFRWPRCGRAVEQQAEGTVVNTDIQYRPRRQLVCLLEDGDDDRGARAQLVLRFFHFYPNQQKALAAGRRVRVFGEVRDGHFGLEIVHPQFKVVEPGAPLPDRLTPVYPTTAGLAQETLRKVIARALAADPALTAETLPDWLVARRHLWKFARRGALPARAAAAPRRAHAARARRAHASGVDAPQVRRAPRAAALAQGASAGARRAARAGADRHGRADRRACSRACRSS